MSVVDDAKELNAEVLVIGSGPGGAVVAATLAEAGRDVLLVEEGPDLAQDSARPFGYEEMASKYRGAGMTVALGRPSVAYAEGRCVGGGSEVNSGLYHRLPDEAVRSWANLFQIDAFFPESLAAHFEACERVTQPAVYPGRRPPASEKLRTGAAALDIESVDVPRLVQFSHDTDAHGVARSRRRSMQETFIKTFRTRGRLRSGLRAERLRALSGGAWEVRARPENGKSCRIRAAAVFVCCGAVHTPALLRRSGMRRNVGDSLSLQPMVKVTAEFPESVNVPGMGIAAEQVKAFSPPWSFGCSISSKAHLAVNLLPVTDGPALAVGRFPGLLSYYVMSQGSASGTVRNLPGMTEPLVRYAVSREEFANLAAGVRALAHMLLEAGAERVFTGVAEQPVVSSVDDLARLPDVLVPGSSNIVTVHLMGSCPMGENLNFAAVDSFGRVHGQAGLYVADASVFCNSPGLNPQGTVMALARRSAMHYLDTL